MSGGVNFDDHPHVFGGDCSRCGAISGTVCRCKEEAEKKELLEVRGNTKSDHERIKDLEVTVKLLKSLVECGVDDRLCEVEQGVAELVEGVEILHNDTDARFVKLP